MTEPFEHDLSARSSGTTSDADSHDTYSMYGIVEAVCTSRRKGTPKEAVESILLRRGYGIEGDAHAGNHHRQVSLLENEKIDMMRSKGLALVPGAFGENIVTTGIALGLLKVGQRFLAGEQAVLQVTQRGKECHARCAIYHKTGDCIMPVHGLFARVVRGGALKAGASVRTDPMFDAVRYAVVTLSDKGSEGRRADTAGPVVCEMLDGALKGNLIATKVLPDDKELIEQELIRLCDEEVCDLIITTGGTGLSPRDVTPEATSAVIDRYIPGMAEAIRAAGLAYTPHAMLSRSVCGLRGSTMILNLSGSPKAVREQLGVVLPVLPHAVSTASGIPQECARKGD